MFFQTKKIFIILIFSLGILGAACSYDQLEEPTISDSCSLIQPTYDETIEELLERTCAYEGCHVSSFSSGDFTSYQEVLPFIEGIQNRTLVLQDMPPSNAPTGKPRTLTSEEQEILECWIANGFPEN